MLVEPDIESLHATMLRQIWSMGKLTESPDENGDNLKWWTLGFNTENLTQEFREVGVLVLNSLHNFARMIQTHLPRSS